MKMTNPSNPSAFYCAAKRLYDVGVENLEDVEMVFGVKMSWEIVPPDLRIRISVANNLDSARIIYSFPSNLDPK